MNSPVLKEPRRVYRIAYLGDPVLRELLSFDAEIADFSKEDDPALVEKSGTQFALFAPVFGNDPEHRSARETLEQTFRSFARTCRKLHLKILFWDRRVSITGKEARRYAAIARDCDDIRAGGPVTQKKYASLLAPRDVGILEPAVQTAIHHPYRVLDHEDPATPAQEDHSSGEGVEASRIAAACDRPRFADSRETLQHRAERHRKWREVFKDHTYADRLSQILELLGLQSSTERFPLATVFISTYRPRLIRRCLDQYLAQTYPSRELVIVAHIDEALEAEVTAAVAETPDARIVPLSRKHGVGACLNLALELAKGEYAIKMDDDDFYGPNYVLDMMLPLRAVDAGLFGKPPAFVYFEKEDATYERRHGYCSPNIICSSIDLASERTRMSGATHSGLTRRLREIGFNERAVFSTDTAFYERCALEAMTVGLWDGFNMSAFRGADKLRHNWRQDDATVRAEASRVGSGKCLDLVFT